MAEVVNLRQARKAKARAEKERSSEANRAKFGRTKAERERIEKQAELAARRLNLHKREPGEKD